MNTSSSRPFHRNLFFAALSLLCLLGTLLSAYLGFLEIALKRGELLGGALCSGNSAVFNCHAVLFGQASNLWGIPLSFIGFLGYAAAGILSYIFWRFDDRQEESLSALHWLSVSFLAADAYLLYVMLAVTRHACLFCLGTYAVNILLWAVSFGALKSLTLRKNIRPAQAIKGLFRRHPSNPVFWTAVLSTLTGLLAVHFTVSYLTRGMPLSQVLSMAQTITPDKLAQVDIAGSPTLGNPEGRVKIVEFSDYLCPTCRNAARYNEIILSKHGRDTSLTYKFFPLDTACNGTITNNVHPGACRLAIASACAAEQGKFWKMHDRFFMKTAPDPARVEEDARAIGLDMPAFSACMAGQKAADTVKKDIEEAGRLGIHSTPTYIVNGVFINGPVTPAGYEELLPGFLEVAKKIKKNNP